MAYLTLLPTDYLNPLELKDIKRRETYKKKIVN